MGFDIHHLHHVGHIVNDMEEGLALYRRLGFRLPPPSYPMLSPAEGAPPRPVGAANTHATLEHNFVELVTCVREDGSSRIPSDADLVPLAAPPEQLPLLSAAIHRTTATLAACLARFQGLHILVFQTPDAGAVAERLRAAGIKHGGANRIARRVNTSQGPRFEPIRFLEIDGDDPKEMGLGRVPEGRIAVAENPSKESLLQESGHDHPNGAVDLVESILCVAPAELDSAALRYEKYLGRTAHAVGATRVFELQNSRITLMTDVELAASLPGERAPALPAFVAYAVAVRDVAATKLFLEKNEFSPRVTAGGDLFVPAAAALGAAVIFRPMT
jgi:catechol 2,3-dioxygenase-like lactoylglutathione lyase family enzyme